LHDIFLREAKSFSPVHQRPAGPVDDHHNPSASRRAAPSPARPAVLRRRGTPHMVGPPRAGLSPGPVAPDPHYLFAERRPLVTNNPKYANRADVTAFPASGTAGADPGGAGESDEPIWDLIELLFFAYRDFVGDPDEVLAKFGFGRAHHR